MVTGGEERYLEWLDREEQVLGIGVTMRASTDIEDAKQLLWRELDYEPKDWQVQPFFEAMQVKYQILPRIDVGFERIEHAWGYQSTYRDLITGRFVSRRDVETTIAALEL